MAGLNDTILKGLERFGIKQEEVEFLNPCGRRARKLAEQAKDDNWNRFHDRYGK